MSDRPILFSAEMVRAILDGRKTQTRRMVKPQPPAEAESVSRQLSSREAPELDGAWQWWAGKPQKPITKPLFCPYGDTGDLLWVRETWAGHASGIDYAADFAAICLPQAGPWRPSIHMRSPSAPPRYGRGRLRMSDRTLRLWYMVIWSGYDNPSLIAANLRNMSAKRVARIIKLRIGYDPGMTEAAWWEANQQRYWNSWFRWQWYDLIHG